MIIRMEALDTLFFRDGKTYQYLRSIISPCN
ncbi:MAG: hypothetical protein A4E56_03343 [Pelotomaculum sp. PtaU1.Bin065]|nr:MAG: hypothetical protein A4E56_03343 [Pelotomaculum sp. PtaU1.Bin065]